MAGHGAVRHEAGLDFEQHRARRIHQDGAERMIAAAAHAARHLEAAAQEFLVIERWQGLGARLSEPGAASFRMNANAARSPSRADERHGTCEMTTVAH